MDGEPTAAPSSIPLWLDCDPGTVWYQPLPAPFSLQLFDNNDLGHDVQPVHTPVLPIPKPTEFCLGRLRHSPRGSSPCPSPFGHKYGPW